MVYSGERRFVSAGDNLDDKKKLPEIGPSAVSLVAGTEKHPYGSEPKVGFGSNFLDKGPTLTQLVVEQEKRKRERKIGFARQEAEPSPKAWLAAFFREPLVRFFLNHAGRGVFQLEEIYKNTNLSTRNFASLQKSIDALNKDFIRIIELFSNDKKVNQSNGELFKFSGVDFKLKSGKKKRECVSGRLIVENKLLGECLNLVFESDQFSAEEKKQIQERFKAWGFSFVEKGNSL